MNSTEQIWRKAIIPAHATIQQVIRNLDQVAIKIVLVVNDAGELEGTISDGDIRRGLLKGLDLNSPITNVIHRNALVVPPEMTREMVKQLMVANKIQQIPTVDEQHHIVAVVAVVGIDAQLVDHLESVLAPVLNVDQGVE